MKGVFVTGTDTDVGKTVFCRALIRSSVGRGQRVAALKPVESGVILDARGEVVDGDALQLDRATGAPRGHAAVCRRAFAEPVSPHLAARRAGVTIDGDELVAFVRQQAEGFDLAVVEGAGGFLVPLSETFLVADLAAGLALPVIVVARERLGVINATLLTVEALRSRGLQLAGVVLIGDPPPVSDNAASIVRCSGVPLLGRLPTLDPAVLADDDRLAATLGAGFDFERLDHALDPDG